MLRYSLWFSMLTAILCSAPPSFALTPDNCTFHAPFDGSFDAAQARGSGKAAVKGDIQFVPGIRGQGILVGAPNTELTYETEKHLNLESGSVSVWIKPETWNDKDAAMRFFFIVDEGDAKLPQDGGTFLWLYRFFSNTTYFLAWDSRGYPTLCSGGTELFKKGEWVHLVGTWNGDEMRLFVNGKPSGWRRVSTPTVLRSLAKTFKVGDPNRANQADTVLDEFRLFDRALTAPEAAALYQFRLQAEPAQQELTVVTLPGTKKVRVDVNALAHKPSEAKEMSARGLLKSGDKTIRETSIKSFSTNHAVVELGTEGLGMGEYHVESRLEKGGTLLAASAASFKIEAPPQWLGSKVGLTDGIPKPWTPLKVQQKGKSGTVECLGPRRYTVDSSFFPTRLSTASQEILASPIQLTGTVNGRPVDLAAAKVEWTRKSPERVEFAAKEVVGNATVSVSSFIEFDGLLWTNLKLNSAAPLKVDRLTLDLPLRKEAATLMYSGFGLEGTGAVRRFSHRIVSNSRLWLGNEDGGLQLTIPSARNWRSKDRNQQIEVLPEEERVVLRLNLIDKESTFQNGVDYSIALQLTPVRPHPEGWRLWRITPPEWVKGTHFNPFYTEGWAVGQSYPIPRDRWKQIYTEETKKGNIATIYLQPFCIWPGMPDYGQFAAEWRTDHSNPPKPFNPEASHMDFSGVCPRPASWGDYFVSTFFNLYEGEYKDMGWGAVYFDVTDAPLCDNADHGCGYIDEYGVRQKEQRYLEHRAVQRRFYTALQERWPEKFLFNHESGDLNMMQLGFCHGMIDGENLCLALVPDNFNYHKILTLDRMRAQYMGHNHGFVPIFLPEFTRAGSGNEEVMERFMGNIEPPEVMHLLGLLFLHDILPWDAYSNPSPYYHLWAVQDAFGWGDDVEFLPYWKNQELVTLLPNNPDVVCTIYRRPGKAMLVLMNNTDEDREISAQINLEKLGVKATSALDAWKGTSYRGMTWKKNDKGDWVRGDPFDYQGVEERLPINSGMLKIHATKRSYRILTIP